MPAAIKLHQLRAFVDVTLQGSIRAASRVSGTSQPALSKAIQELEQFLGARLFIRQQQGVVLTDIGQNFYKHASLVLEELRLAQEGVRQQLGLAGGKVNIGVGSCIARVIMPQVITRFHHEYPNVQLRITEGQLVSMLPELRQGLLDFTINTYDENNFDSELSYQRILEKEYRVVVRRGHPCAQAKSLEALQHCDWTLPTPKGSYYRLLKDMFVTMNMTPSVMVNSETFMVCASLVANSDFVTILSEDVVTDPGFSRQLVALELEQPLPKASFYLIQRRDTALTPMSAYLAQLFRHYCRD